MGILEALKEYDSRKGESGQVLTTDGEGGLRWQNPPSGDPEWDWWTALPDIQTLPDAR